MYVGIFYPWSQTALQVSVPSVTLSQTSTGAPCPAGGSVKRPALATVIGQVVRRERAARRAAARGTRGSLGP